MNINPKEWANADEWMTTVQLADATKTSRSFWDKARVRGDGPPYVLVGNRPRYNRSTTEAWLIGRTVRSTSERRP
jgi:hypothetical protein